MAKTSEPAAEARAIAPKGAVPDGNLAKRQRQIVEHENALLGREHINTKCSKSRRGWQSPRRPGKCARCAGGNPAGAFGLGTGFFSSSYLIANSSSPLSVYSATDRRHWRGVLGKKVSNITLCLFVAGEVPEWRLSGSQALSPLAYQILTIKWKESTLRSMDEQNTDVIQGTLEHAHPQNVEPLSLCMGSASLGGSRQISRSVFKVNPGSLLTAFQRAGADGVARFGMARDR